MLKKGAMRFQPWPLQLGPEGRSSRIYSFTVDEAQMPNASYFDWSRLSLAAEIKVLYRTVTGLAGDEMIRGMGFSASR